MGRTSKYETEIQPYIEDIKKAVAAGATIEEIAKAFSINVSTLYRYKAEKKELNEAFACGRAKIIFEIKAALLKKAVGYDYEEERRTGKKDKNGENVVVVETYRRHMPPSETAAAMLLRNYDQTWLDKDATSVDLKKQELDLRKAMAEANNFNIDI